MQGRVSALQDSCMRKVRCTYRSAGMMTKISLDCLQFQSEAPTLQYTPALLRLDPWLSEFLAAADDFNCCLCARAAGLTGWYGFPPVVSSGATSQASEIGRCNTGIYLEVVQHFRKKILSVVS